MHEGSYSGQPLLPLFGVNVKYRPIYLLSEFNVVIITVAYIPPAANANLYLRHLHSSISSQQSWYPDIVLIIPGYFNHVDLKAVLPKIHQHVKCGTRGANTLDKVYSNIQIGYRATFTPGSV